MRARLDIATRSLLFARRFAKSYLEGLADDDWWWQPQPGVNNLAWQVGHLAVAEYALCLKRVRGAREEDARFMPADFLERYKRGSLPSADPDENIAPEESLRVLDAVREQVLAESAAWTDAQLDVASDPPHRLLETRLESFEWSSQHELTHVGQIVLLRRLRGKPIEW